MFRNLTITVFGIVSVSLLSSCGLITKKDEVAKDEQVQQVNNEKTEKTEKEGDEKEETEKQEGSEKEETEK